MPRRYNDPLRGEDARLYDEYGNLSVDPNTRTLVTSDGSTVMLDYATKGTIYLGPQGVNTAGGWLSKIDGGGTDGADYYEIYLRTNNGWIDIVDDEGDPTNTYTEIGAQHLRLPSLPTSDPHVANQIWNSSGTLKVSAGP